MSKVYLGSLSKQVVTCLERIVVVGAVVVRARSLPGDLDSGISGETSNEVASLLFSIVSVMLRLLAVGDLKESSQAKTILPMLKQVY